MCKPQTKVGKMGRLDPNLKEKKRSIRSEPNEVEGERKMR